MFACVDGATFREAETVLRTLLAAETTPSRTTVPRLQHCVIAIITATVSALLMASSTSARELVIANVAPFSGNGATAGRDFNLGLMLCLDQTNQSGGVNGHTLRLVSRDDGSRDDETVRLVREAVDTERAIALVGLSGSSNIAAVLKSGVLQRGAVPVVGVRSGAISLRSEPNLFHLQSNAVQESAQLMEQLKRLSLERVAVFYQSDSTGQDGLRGAMESASKLGLSLVASATFERFTLDVGPAVARIAQADPSAVIILADTNATYAFIQAYRKVGGKAQLVASSMAEPGLLVEQLGSKDSPGVGLSLVVPSPQRQNSKLVNDFRALLRTLDIPAARANFASMSGYIAGRVAVEAIRRTGRDPTPTKVMAALDGMNQFDIGGYVVDFGNKEREGMRYADLAVISRAGQILQ
jgi:branched-chain amino acid transport system substrate-binding protein